MALLNFIQLCRFNGAANQPRSRLLLYNLIKIKHLRSSIVVANERNQWKMNGSEWSLGMLW